jgi:hypothetical protein
LGQEGIGTRRNMDKKEYGQEGIWTRRNMRQEEIMGKRGIRNKKYSN